MTIRIAVCHNRTSLRAGSSAVCSAFREYTQDMAGVEVLAAGCLGQCGSGPNVVVQLPDKNPFWYMGIWPEAVPVIVQQHLKQGLPVWELLSCSKHPHARRDYGPAPEGLFTKVRTLLGLG